MSTPEELLRVADGSVCVRRRGAGVPVVLVHGNSCSSRAFEKQLASGLSDTMQLLAIDLPGHGDSSPAAAPDETNTLPGYAAVLVQAIHELDVPDAIVVGWSMGGHVALEASPDLPRARGYLIFGTPPVRTGADFARCFAPEPAIAAAFRAQSSEEEVRQLLSLFVRPGVSPPQRFVDDFHRADPRARAALAASLERGDYRDEVAIVGELRAPLAVVHGVAEGVVVRGYFDTVSMPTLWRGAVQEVPDAGHAPQWENPEAFNDLLGAFVRECGEGG